MAWHVGFIVIWLDCDGLLSQRRVDEARGVNITHVATLVEAFG